MPQSFDYNIQMYSYDKRPETTYPVKLATYLEKKYSLKKESILVDMGCGRGDLLRAFHALGYNVKGVDHSPDTQELCKPHEVIECDFEKQKVGIKDNSVDIVFSKSVIEHLENPLRFVREAHRILKPNGVFILMTPSWRHHFRGAFYLDFTHKSPFTLKSVKDILEVSSFKVEHKQHFIQLPFVWYYPWLLPFVKLFSLFPIPYEPLDDVNLPASFNRLVRFSKEVMLLAVAKKK